jgi:hypothetical protein
MADGPPRAWSAPERFIRAPAQSVVTTMVIVLAIHVLLTRWQFMPSASGQYDILLGAAYFVFGLVVTFAIENARNKAARVNELLKASDSDLVSIHQLGAVFGERIRSDLLTLIDIHVQDQIDYSITDFSESAGSFMNLFDRITALDPHGPQEEIAYDHLLGVCLGAAERRKHLEAIARQRISVAEWITLLTLFAALWGLLIATVSGMWLVDLLAGVLIACLAGMLRLLVCLDHNIWQESDAIWQPLHLLFESLGLAPYYPRDVIERGRAKPKSGPIRVASYPNDYPNMKDKTIVQVQVSANGVVDLSDHRQA